MKPLEQEFEYYLQNQDQLVQKYDGKVLVIKDHTVLGAYNSDWEAIQETTKTHPLGTFLVQPCAPGKDNYTQVFHSRATFA